MSLSLAEEIELFVTSSDENLHVPARVLRWLSAYAATLRQQAETKSGVTGEVVERACVAASASTGEGIRAMSWPDDFSANDLRTGRIYMRAALEAVWPQAALVQSTQDHCQCRECAGGVIHASDCAVHNMPAMPNGPCDCGSVAQSTQGEASPEDCFEQYVATLIDKNPNVRELGKRLALWLDDDKFNNVEPVLLGIAKALHPERARVPAEPLRIFSPGEWKYVETDQTFSARDLDEAAFVEYRGWLAAAPSQPADPSHD